MSQLGRRPTRQVSKDDRIGSGASKLGLGSMEARGRQVRMLLDGYELPSADRVGFMALVRDFAVLNAANEISSNLALQETDPKSLLEAVIWRSRSAGWLVKHHDALDRIVTGYS